MPNSKNDPPAEAKAEFEKILSRLPDADQVVFREFFEKIFLLLAEGMGEIKKDVSYVADRKMICRRKVMNTLSNLKHCIGTSQSMIRGLALHAQMKAG